MATSDKPKSSDGMPRDLLPLIQSSGVLSERQFDEIKSKVFTGDYPFDPQALAQRLVQEAILTEYQAKRLLKNKTNGLVVGRYAILDRLGSGAMGRVYKAHHLMMDRVVALKIIAPEIATNQRVIGRFQREMKLVGRLDHPNVVRAYDADQINQILYIVMEFVSGESLGQHLRRGLIPPLQMIDYAAQAALGLAHAHEQGIVHRDVKPSNLLLTGEGRVKVLDLGLGVLMEADDASSFATADGVAVGTIDYMSPEQACGKEVDGRSDLFSLGCAIYHLTTGRLPFPGESPIERLGKRISGKPVPITEVRGDLPHGLVQVLDRLMANKPTDRIQTAREAAEILEALIRPKIKANSVESPRKSVKESSPSLAGPAPSALPLEVIRIKPEYPGWFQPLAALAEKKPPAALALVLGALTGAFGLGFLTSWLMR